MLLILFGLPGSGKNFAGKILEDDFGFRFHDGDDDLPPEMRQAIVNQQIATDAMRAAHTQNIVGQVETLRLQGNKRIALSGAFFKEQHRQQFLERFPEAAFVLVDTLPHLRREWLARRQNHLADVDYAEKIISAFEPPRHAYHVLMNSAGREELREQIGVLLAGLGG